MSDYMFMLESHLNADQASAFSEVRGAAQDEGLSIYLTGGAIRDMFGGFPIRDLDFTVEGDPAKLVSRLTAKGATVVSSDSLRHKTELLFRRAVTVGIGMSRTENYPKPAAKPQVTPATIYDDLRGRDFTINALALSVNRASKGLLIDPNNGLSDLERRELRVVTSHTFYDMPVRMLRLLRFETRLGFTRADRTQSQFENAKEAGVHKLLSAGALLEEMRAMATEQKPVELLQALEREGLLQLLSPALTTASIPLATLGKLLKARQMMPFGVDLRTDYLGLFLNVLTEKLSTKDRSALYAKLDPKGLRTASWNKLDARARKLEKQLKGASLVKPSAIYDIVAKADGESVLYLLAKSTERLVQDRLKNYLQKYAPAAAEVTDALVRQSGGGEPGSPKFVRKRHEMVAARLDARPKRPKAPPPAPAPPVAPVSTGRRASPSIR
ncbi:MAG TPA: hypothetical protein VE621_17235 [Bryobacteraceae bacterium]|nr:hypothetical protein [Bryobacteraceae bacterium]